MKDFRLSEHFTLAEFERSATATKYGIDNRVPSSLIPALQQLCQTILEPLRTFASQPIPLSSGYRCNQLNIKVGGVYASQHTLGEAADIQIPKTTYTEWSDGLAHTDKQILYTWFDWIKTHCDFDQLIVETSNGKDFWIHVSCRKNRERNRHQVIRELQK